MRKGNENPIGKLDLENRKRHLVDVMIVDGTVEGGGRWEKKLKPCETLKEALTNKPDVVLGA